MNEQTKQLQQDFFRQLGLEQQIRDFIESEEVQQIVTDNYWVLKKKLEKILEEICTENAEKAEEIQNKITSGETEKRYNESVIHLFSSRLYEITKNIYDFTLVGAPDEEKKNFISDCFTKSREKFVEIVKEFADVTINVNVTNAICYISSANSQKKIREVLSNLLTGKGVNID